MCLRLDAALDLELDVTKHYTGQYFYDEAAGLAYATGIDVKVSTRTTIERWK